MYGKASRKILSMIVAIALVLTSGIGVFAASSQSSPTGGKTTAAGTVTNIGTKVSAPNKTITIIWDGTASQYQVFVNGALIATTAEKSFVFKGKSNGRYDICVKAADSNSTSAVVKRWIKKTEKASAKKAGSKKVKVSWKKVKNVKNYVIEAYNSNGVLVKTVTAKKSETSKTIKLDKGTYTFRIIPVYKNGGYTGAYKKTGSVKVK